MSWLMCNASDQSTLNINRLWFLLLVNEYALKLTWPVCRLLNNRQELYAAHTVYFEEAVCWQFSNLQFAQSSAASMSHLCDRLITRQWLYATAAHLKTVWQNVLRVLKMNETVVKSLWGNRHGSGSAGDMFEAYPVSATPMASANGQCQQLKNQFLLSDWFCGGLPWRNECIANCVRTNEIMLWDYHSRLHFFQIFGRYNTVLVSTVLKLSFFLMEAINRGLTRLLHGVFCMIHHFKLLHWSK